MKDDGSGDGTLAGVDVLFHDIASHFLPSFRHSTMVHIGSR